MTHTSTLTLEHRADRLRALGFDIQRSGNGFSLTDPVADSFSFNLALGSLREVVERAERHVGPTLNTVSLEGDTWTVSKIVPEPAHSMHQLDDTLRQAAG